MSMPQTLESPVSLSIDDIEALYYDVGGRLYGGECVSQLEHALQAAHAAERSGAGDALVTAVLLHDIGHLIEPAPIRHPSERPGDDRHQERAAAMLEALFGAAIVEPVRLHVDAKRWLCAVDVQYRSRLSAASVRSLYLQGGAFDAREAEAFEELPYARDAVLLRHWDDAAKVVGAVTPSLEHFLERARRCVRSDASELTLPRAPLADRACGVAAAPMAPFATLARASRHASGIPSHGAVPG